MAGIRNGERKDGRTYDKTDGRHARQRYVNQSLRQEHAPAHMPVVWTDWLKATRHCGNAYAPGPLGTAPQSSTMAPLARELRARLGQTRGCERGARAWPRLEL